VSEDSNDLVDRTRRFIADHVLGTDDEFDGDVNASGGDGLRVKLQEAAREAGIFEEAGYSLFGPMALNIAAPDEGNVHLLDQVASAAQRERYLAPLARGLVRSAFAMTEPAPGAGSDPSALRTMAARVSGGWVINGRKHFITGADGAAFFIIFARTSGFPGDSGGATAKASNWSATWARRTGPRLAATARWR